MIDSFSWRDSMQKLVRKSGRILRNLSGEESKTPKNPLNPSCVEFFLMHLSKRFHDTQVVVVNINVVKRCHVKQTRVMVFVGITQ